MSERPGPARLIAPVHRLDHRHYKPPNTYDHGMNRPGESGDPSHRSCAEACPLPARIALSYLMDWPQRSRPQDRLPGDARLQAPTGDGQRADAVTSPFIGLAVVTRLETCCSPSGLPVSRAAPYGYSQPGTGCLATPCECGCEASALAGTHIAEYFLPTAMPWAQLAVRRSSGSARPLACRSAATLAGRGLKTDVPGAGSVRS